MLPFHGRNRIFQRNFLLPLRDNTAQMRQAGRGLEKKSPSTYRERPKMKKHTSQQQPVPKDRKKYLE